MCRYIYYRNDKCTQLKAQSCMQVSNMSSLKKGCYYVALVKAIISFTLRHQTLTAPEWNDLKVQLILCKDIPDKKTGHECIATWQGWRGEVSVNSKIVESFATFTLFKHACIAQGHRAWTTIRSISDFSQFVNHLFPGDVDVNIHVVV